MCIFKGGFDQHEATANSWLLIHQWKCQKVLSLSNHLCVCPPHVGSLKALASSGSDLWCHLGRTDVCYPDLCEVFNKPSDNSDCFTEFFEHTNPSGGRGAAFFFFFLPGRRKQRKPILDLLLLLKSFERCLLLAPAFSLSERKRRCVIPALTTTSAESSFIPFFCIWRRERRWRLRTKQARTPY